VEDEVCVTSGESRALLSRGRGEVEVPWKVVKYFKTERKFLFYMMEKINRYFLNFFCL